MVVMACNTTNALAFDLVEARAGVCGPWLDRQCGQRTAADRVGVLATGHSGSAPMALACVELAP